MMDKFYERRHKILIPNAKTWAKSVKQYFLHCPLRFFFIFFFTYFSTTAWNVCGYSGIYSVSANDNIYSNRKYNRI